MLEEAVVVVNWAVEVANAVNGLIKIEHLCETVLFFYGCYLRWLRC